MFRIHMMCVFIKQNNCLILFLNTDKEREKNKIKILNKPFKYRIIFTLKAGSINTNSLKTNVHNKIEQHIFTG